ncbi:hypothetical protein [Cellulomonas hominis]|uniref:hypothetical protein n=1 Tax=Cellulomonas hominis TaxID=156981 RepID=UPI0014446A89|nr:hypothetical protein [Cellulomonas hominis]NKY10667.1 hypothetical protein [Cellulomonas hominis]
MSVAVETSALDTAAVELEEAAAALQAADVAGPFAPVPDALPGSATGEAAVWVSTRVAAAVQVLGENVRGMAASASGTADGYRGAEASTSGRFAGMVPQ